jgi:hypothetical protein
MRGLDGIRLMLARAACDGIDRVWAGPHILRLHHNNVLCVPLIDPIGLRPGR